MKVIVRRNWADASKAWIDVQTYTGLKLPPAGMQYKLSFMDKDSIPAQMIVTSDGPSWVDGLGGGYKGKTVLDMTIEEPQRGSESGGGASWETVEGGGSGDVQGESVLSSSIVTLPSAVVVSGAGTANCNGEYTYDGYIDNKPSYIKGDFKIYWSSGDEVFLLASGYTAYYGGEGDVLSPDLVLEWDVYDGEEPAPTVTALAGMEVVRNVDAGKALLADGAGGASWGDVLPMPDPLMYDLILSGTNTDADGTYICTYNGEFSYEREDNTNYKIVYGGNTWQIYKVIDPFEGTNLYYYYSFSRLPRADMVPLSGWFNNQAGDQPPILTKTNGRENQSDVTFKFTTDTDNRTVIWRFGS